MAQNIKLYLSKIIFSNTLTIINHSISHSKSNEINLCVFNSWGVGKLVQKHVGSQNIRFLQRNTYKHIYWVRACASATLIHIHISRWYLNCTFYYFCINVVFIYGIRISWKLYSKWNPALLPYYDRHTALKINDPAELYATAFVDFYFYQHIFDQYNIFLVHRMFFFIYFFYLYSCCIQASSKPTFHAKQPNFPSLSHM